MTPTTPLAYLSHLFNGVTLDPGFLELRFLPGKARRFIQWPIFEGHPEAARLDDLPTTQNVYFGISLRLAAGKGGRADVQISPHAWIDLDLKGTQYVGGELDLTSWALGELRVAARRQYDEFMAEAERQAMPPMSVLYTGHGLQVTWAREAPPHGLDDVEALNKGLAVLFEPYGADPKVFDAARIFRLPGTFNVKNPERPILVEVWHLDPTKPRVPDRVFKPHHLYPETTPAPAPRSTTAGQASVIEAWRQQHPLRDVLGRNGYQPGTAEDRMTRPGQDASGDDVHLLRDAGTGEWRSYHHSSNDPLASVQGSQHTRDAFDVFMHLEHGGRFDDALAAARRDLGLADEGKAGKISKAATATAQLLDKKSTLTDLRDRVLDVWAEEGQVYRYHQTWQSWWIYRAGVYEEVGLIIMEQRVEHILEASGLEHLRTSDLREVLGKLSRRREIGQPKVDQDAWELNVRNGILNLRTLELRAHSPDYFSVVQSRAAYRPEIVAHQWADFLHEALPRAGARLVLQEFAGYCLTGDTSAAFWALVVGDGGTGKSTVSRILQAVLGSLATSSSLEIIRDGSFLIGTLVGRRMCVISEIQRNVDWLPFKRITGEDPISVDIKNRDPYITKLDAKLLILSNVMPFLGDDATNASLSRRFLPIRFDVKPQTPDPSLERRLTAQDELDGVLSWAVQGLRRLVAQHMAFGAGSDDDLGRELVEESNRAVAFLRDQCQPGGETSSATLYGAYTDWCQTTNHRPLSSTSFPKSLIAAAAHLGGAAEKVKTKTGAQFIGVSLRSTHLPPTPWPADGDGL